MGDRKGENRDSPPSFRAEALPRAGYKQEAIFAVFSELLCCIYRASGSHESLLL